MLYRTIWPISLPTGETVPAGILSPLAGVNAKSLAALETRGAIAPVSSPPLAALPNWQARARKLAAAGITTVLEVVEADPVKTARTCRLSAALFAGWQDEARAILTHEPEVGSGNGYAGG